MTTDLRGATHSPAPEGWAQTPGEFAARWNEMALAGRGELVGRINAAARASHACWAQAHVPGEVAAEREARVRAEAFAAGRADVLTAAVDALEAAGMPAAARVVDGLAVAGRWVGASDVP